jgi:hypothetical protein
MPGGVRGAATVPATSGDGAHDHANTAPINAP